MTNIISVDQATPDPVVLERAGALIRAGRLVAFPTETVYGLGANALDDDAVAMIFETKGRAADDPLIVHLASSDHLDEVAVNVPTAARLLGRVFWPGPLTLVLLKHPRISNRVTAGLATVAVRVPNHPVATGLLVAAGVPIVAPSANLFTRISPTTAAHVADDLGDRVDLIIDGGPTRHGIESTVVAVSEDRVRLLRPGATSIEALAEVLSDVQQEIALFQSAEGGVGSPGLMQKHYAPRASVRFFTGPPEATLPALHAAARREVSEGRRVGLLLCDEDAPAFADTEPLAIVERLGKCSDLSQVARRLYAGMRALDAAGVATICVRDFGTAGLGLAILDRLTRAANHQVIRVE